MATWEYKIGKKDKDGQCTITGTRTDSTDPENPIVHTYSVFGLLTSRPGQTDAQMHAGIARAIHQQHVKAMKPEPPDGHAVALKLATEALEK